MRTHNKVEMVECEECGEKVAANWLKRHVTSGCQVGVRGRRAREEQQKQFSWDVRPANGQVIMVWNRFVKIWEEMSYLMEDGGTLKAEDGWTGRVSRYRRLYPKWKE